MTTTIKPELKESILKTIFNIFPNSFIEVEKACLGNDSFHITFALGKDKSEFSNGIIQNDISLIRFYVECNSDDTYNIENNDARSIKIKPTESYLYCSSVKIPFRRSKNINESKLLDVLDKFFNRLKDQLILEYNNDNLLPYGRELVKNKLI